MDFLIATGGGQWLKTGMSWLMSSEPEFRREGYTFWDWMMHHRRLRFISMHGMIVYWGGFLSTRSPWIVWQKRESTTILQCCIQVRRDQGQSLGTYKKLKITNYKKRKEESHYLNHWQFQGQYKSVTTDRYSLSKLYMEPAHKFRFNSNST